MPIRTVSIPAVWALDASTARIFGQPSSINVAIESRALPWTTPVERRWTTRAKLAAGSTQGAFGFPPRSFGGLRGIVGMELHADIPDGTELRFQVVIGGTSYRWHDGAWVDDVVEWTPWADLLAHVSELPFDAIRAGGLAMQVLLMGTAVVTPIFYGLTWLSTIHHAESSASAVRGASQRGELGTALTAAIRAGFRLAWFEELVSTGAESYSFDPPGDSSAGVVGIDGVWNVSTDAELSEPLDVEFLGGVATFPEEPPPAGPTLRFATRIAPTVSEGGDVDLVVDSLPAIVLRFPRELRTRRLRYRVSGAADGQNRPTVRGPRVETVEIIARLIADSPQAVDALREQLAEWFEPNDGSDRVGRTIELASTGHRAVVRWGEVREDLAPAGDAWQTAVALVVEGFAVWTGGTINVPTVSVPDFDGGL